MIVGIFSVLQKGTQTFDPARKYLFNINRLFAPTRVTDDSTQLLWNSTNLPSPPQGILVEAGFETIQNSLAGTKDPTATYTFTPNFINGVANSEVQQIVVGNIQYAIMSGSNALLFVLNDNNVLTPTQYQINSTSLEALLVRLNNISSNIAFTGTFGSCGTSSQAFTYDVNQAVTLQLQVQTGEAWVPIAQQAVSAGSGSVTFGFNPGDAVLNDAIRVVAITSNGDIYEITSRQFACAGGTGSGSGSSGDCNMYAYFDGNQWNNTLKTLNIGDTCSVGYNLQIASDPSFATDKLIEDIETQATIVQFLDLPNGTYYARVANLSGETRFSATLTFTNS